MNTLTINKFNPQTGNYDVYAHQQLTDADVELIAYYFDKKTVIEGFYQITIQGNNVLRNATYYTIHADVLGYLKAPVNTP